MSVFINLGATSAADLFYRGPTEFSRELSSYYVIRFRAAAVSVLLRARVSHSVFVGGEVVFFSCAAAALPRNRNQEFLIHRNRIYYIPIHSKHAQTVHSVYIQGHTYVSPS